MELHHFGDADDVSVNSKGDHSVFWALTGCYLCIVGNLSNVAKMPGIWLLEKHWHSVFTVLGRCNPFLSQLLKKNPNWNQTSKLLNSVSREWGRCQEGVSHALFSDSFNNYWYTAWHSVHSSRLGSQFTFWVVCVQVSTSFQGNLATSVISLLFLRGHFF